MLVAIVMLVALGAFAYAREKRIEAVQQPVVRDEPTVQPTPIVITGTSAIYETLPGVARRLVVADIYFENVTADQYALTFNYETTLHAPPKTDADLGVLVSVMRAVLDTNTKEGKAAPGSEPGVIGPFGSQFTSTDAYIHHIRLLSPQQDAQFRTGRLIYIFVGNIVATRGSAVYTIPYCGYGLYTFSDLVTHACPPEGT